MFWMKECDILVGQNILWPSYIFPGGQDLPNPRIYAPGYNYCSTAIRLQFDRVIRPSGDLRHHRAAALRPKYINRSAWLRRAGYITVTLMTFHEESIWTSNVSRTAVESKPNRIHRIVDTIYHKLYKLVGCATCTFTLELVNHQSIIFYLPKTKTHTLVYVDTSMAG